MPEPTVAELFRLDEILLMPDELRFRRLYAAYAVKFGWPFCTGDCQLLWGDDAATAWKRWGGLEVEEVEYSL